MERNIIWSAWEGPGAEHLRLTLHEEGSAADGLIVGLEGDQPFRIGYEVRCDVRWRVRELRVGVPGSNRPDIDLLADGEGRWTMRGGDAVSELEGCVDADISATPFTNTLPIRRLGLEPGQSADLKVAFVDVPDPALRAEPQRYTYLEERADGGLYRFQAPPGKDLPDGFTAELPVDAEGLVIDYPGLFRRAWSG